MLSSLLKMILILGVIALGGLFLFWSGLLPAGMYPAIYSSIDALPINQQASEPYLQKYEGHWTLTFYAGKPSSAYLDCPAFSVIASAHDGQFLAHASVPGYLLGVEASSSVSGVLTGIFYSGNRSYQGTVYGAIKNGDGDGTWQDNEDCFGTWVLKKISPVIDPAQGKITSVDGRVMLVRSSTTEEAWPEEGLYAGDVIKVPAGGKAILQLGLDQHLVTISSDQTYIVQDMQP